MKTNETKSMKTQLITSWAESDGLSVLSLQWKLAQFWQTNLIDFRIILMGVSVTGTEGLLVLDWKKGSIPLISLEMLAKDCMLNIVMVLRS